MGMGMNMNNECIFISIFILRSSAAVWCDVATFD